jgi:hypothetical protein
MGMDHVNRRVDDILRVEAARDAAAELGVMLRDLRDEKLPGSSLYLALDRSAACAALAVSELLGVLDTLRFP